MNLKSTIIEGMSKDVISEDEFKSKYGLYTENKSIQSVTAVEANYNNHEYILPIRGKSDDRPGIYPNGAVYFIKTPEEGDRSFDKENLTIADFSDVTTLNEYFEKNSQLKKMEVDTLNESDDIYKPTYSGNESAEMKAVKDAITSKSMDLNKYAPRFGDNFLNTKRLLKGDSITMNKLIEVSNALDIEAELILRNASTDIANPMANEIHMIITKRDNNE